MYKPKRIPHFIFCFVFFTAVNFSSAQLPQKDFYFRHITTEQGLSYGVINDLLKSKDGLLWIGTYNGLNCFDGSHFKVWKANPADSNALQNNVVEAMCEDSHGNIWCATNGGIARFDRKIFKNYPLTLQGGNREKTSTPYEIICTRAGEIITSTIYGIFIYDPVQDKFIRYTGNPDEGAKLTGTIYKNAFVEDTVNNGIWIGSYYGLRYFDLKDKIFYNSGYNPNHIPVLNMHIVSTLTLDRHNRLVFYDVTDKKLVTYDYKSNAVTSEISTETWGIGDSFFATIFFDSDENTWISTWNYHSFYIEAATGKAYELKRQSDNKYSLLSNFSWDVLQDNDGTIYLGTLNGVSFTNVKNNFFSIHHFPDNIQHTTEYVNRFILGVDRQNNIWLAPNYQYLLRYNTAEDSYTKYEFLPEKVKKKDELNIGSMLVKEDTLLFGTIDGIYSYDIKTEKFSRLTLIPDSAFEKGTGITPMIETSKGEIWFANVGNGLFRLNPAAQTFKHYLNHPLNSKTITGRIITDIHENLDGTIWLSTMGDGLIKYNAQEDNFEYLSHSDSNEVFKSDFFKIENDKQGNLWLLSTVSGLIKYSPKTKNTRMMFPGSGMADLVYGTMMMDENEKLWLSFYYHYTVYDTRTNKSENFEIDYSKDDLRYINNFDKMQDGRILTESLDAFIIIDPKKRAAPYEMEPVIISHFKAGNKEQNFLSPSEKIMLEHNQNSFSFDFSTLSFLKDNNIQFSYKLEGLDNDWTDCGSRQTAYFTNISGGDYIFHVRAKRPEGNWIESTAPIKISIAKTFYTTVWFRLLLFCAIVFCALWYIRLLKRRQLRRESEKAIAYFANSLQGKSKVEELLWDITHNVITRTDFVDCVVYLLDERKQALVQKAAYGNKNPDEYEILNPMDIPLGQGIVGTVAATGKAEIVSDTSKDERYIADDSSRLSEIAVPIVAEGKVIGVIDSEHPRKNFFTNEHLNLLTTIASITATKIIKARKEMEIEENKHRLEDLKTQVIQTRQLALRAQMNPHFIFNCLNSINGFILQNDSITASTYLIKFSKLIRLILEHSNEKSISLQSELDALKLYIEMEALRFEKKFSYTIDVDKNISTDSVQVPPLLLQPFVENSIWHGLLHKETEGHLQVRIMQNNGSLECVIEDNGVGREQSGEQKSKISTHKKSLGIKLTRERLALLNGQLSAESYVKVVDLKNDNGTPAGTKVIISVPLTTD